MDRNVAQPSWTDTQWNAVLKTVSEEAQRARTAAQFLPIAGPIDASTVAVPSFRLANPLNPDAPPAERLETNNLPNLTFTTIAVPVSLATAEVSDPDLAAGLVKFRRAANIIARIEDALVFNDRTAAGPPSAGIGGIPNVFLVTGGGPAPGDAFQFGLLPLDSGQGPTTPAGGRIVVPVPIPTVIPPAGQGRLVALTDYGSVIVDGIVAAIGALENAGQSGPFACVLGQLPYEAVYAPTANFIAAKDRILPILGGPLLRSSCITSIAGAEPKGGYAYGVVVALGGNPIELIVASDISVQFLQVTLEPRYVFRVSERISLRVTDPSAIAVLSPVEPNRKAKRHE
jgi:uncharacterized linocin/CFP29 family protein